MCIRDSSRQDRGYFIPGGKRLTSPEGEELFSYFEKGDGKPPFAVYFSGYRQQEGFEGYYMMRNLGCPFILFTDPRSEGGAFYVGNEAYESLIVDEIREKMETLGFTKKDLVLSGASMEMCIRDRSQQAQVPQKAKVPQKAQANQQVRVNQQVQVNQ